MIELSFSVIKASQANRRIRGFRGRNVRNIKLIIPLSALSLTQRREIVPSQLSTFLSNLDLIAALDWRQFSMENVLHNLQPIKRKEKLPLSLNPSSSLTPSQQGFLKT